MSEGVQTGVAMAAIAMISTVVGLVVGFFKDRDKLHDEADKRRYDAEFIALRSQNAGQAAQLSQQAAQIQALTTTQEECEEKHKECEEKHNSQEIDIKDIRAEIAKLKK